MSDNQDVKDFQTKFEIPMAETPTFLSNDDFVFRCNFMYEELAEFELGHQQKNMEDVADALVDLAYVIHGTALMMGIPWAKIWDEVQRANMTKVRATSAEQSKRNSAIDVVKPEGWQGPDHRSALDIPK